MHYIDLGTLSLLASTRFTSDDKVLDLGCGYGPVGIYAAKLLGAERVHMLRRRAADETMSDEGSVLYA
jgi:16S rRNA (guanine1207-N2)-methyltransferase